MPLVTTGAVSNNISVVISVTHGGRSILLAGHAEALAWEDTVRVYGESQRSDVLKASPRGRDSGYHMEPVRHVAPELTVMLVEGVSNRCQRQRPSLFGRGRKHVTPHRGDA